MEKIWLVKQAIEILETIIFTYRNLVNTFLVK